MPSLPFHLPRFKIRHILTTEKCLVISARSTRKKARCPDCGINSSRIHASYVRRPADLPVLNRSVHLKLRVRRFCCISKSCTRKTFSERIPDLIAPYARRTRRLTTALRHIGFALGGEAGSRLARRLGMPVSGDTLIRIILGTDSPLQVNPQIIGIDDWAWRKRHHYGTIIVDLQRRCVIDLLPDRSSLTLSNWLSQYSAIRILARDRSTEYAAGMRSGAPNAIQVADRWHLLCNLGDMVERMSEQLYKKIKVLPGGTSTQQTPKRRPFLRSPGEEHIRDVKRKKRQKLREMVRYMHAQGASKRRIARLLELSRTTVHRYLDVEGETSHSLRRARPSMVDPYLDYLEKRWEEGCSNAKELWREIQEKGYPGTHRQVARWAYMKRSTPAPTTPKSYHDRIIKGENSSSSRAAIILPRQIRWLFTKPPAKLSDEESKILAHICNDQTVNTAYELVQQYASMVRSERPEAFEHWYERASGCGIGVISRFAKHVYKDREAVMAAMTLKWSNGQVEGRSTN